MFFLPMELLTQREDVAVSMNISRFQESDRDDVRRLHEEIFGRMNLARFLWQPCQQIESLEKDGGKLVCKDEEVKGYAAAYRVDGNSFRLNLLTRPQSARQGIGSSLLDEIEAEIKREGGRQLEARLLEGMDESLRFALSRGFTEVHRMRGMSLDAGDFSFEKWRGLGEKLSAEGFTVTTLKREAEDGKNPLAKLVELQRRAVEGWYQTGLINETETTNEQWRLHFSHITFPDRVSIIKHKEQYVGYTSAERSNLLGTAVHPDYRGLGLATYLKAYDLRRLIDAGIEYFESSSANPAMLRINHKLGYWFNGLAEIRLAKRL